MLRVLDLFSGIGGFSLGLERTGGFETVGFCEVDPFCQKVLAKHWPDVPIYDDVRTLDARAVGHIDIITGGYPCQPFSTASRGKRVARDWWPEMLRIIADIRPGFVVVENVQELPIKRSISELDGIGYRGFCRRIAASDCGADHIRSRWWGIAYTDMRSKLRGAVNAEAQKLPQLCGGVWGAANYSRALRVSNGVSDRAHRLKSLGNAVVPQIPEMIGRAILNEEVIC